MNSNSKNKCKLYDHCYWDKNSCKLFLNKDMYEYVFKKIIDELVNNEIKRYEILNNKLEEIIDKSKYLNPKKEYNIYQIPNKSVKKLILKK